MKKYVAIFVLIVALGAALGAILHVRGTKETARAPGGSGTAEEFSASRVASPALTTPFYAEDGTSRTLVSYKGRPVLVNFWATWCGPCRAEMPSLERLAKRMAPEGLAVVALSQDLNGWPKITPFLATLKLDSLPVYLDRNGAIARVLGVEALPTTYLFGRDGKPLGRFVGEVDWDSARADAMLRKHAFAQGRN